MEMIRAGLLGPEELNNNDRPWDQKGRTMISHIYVSFNELKITSVQFGYLENGSLVLSEMFGKSDRNFRVVKLSQDEYITGLSGAVGGGYGGVIKNLTFHTNRGKHGPIGSRDNCDEDYLKIKIDPDMSDLKIKIDPAISNRSEFGGFFGTHNQYNLSSIGIYLCPFGSSSHTVVNREKSSSTKKFRRTVQH